MSKVLKGMLVFVLSFVCMFGATGCGGGLFIQTEEIDETKTQLYVSNYDGGVGTQWLRDIADKFEEKYKDYEFEPGSGKKGVEVKIDTNKDLRSDLGNKIATSTNNVYFGERMFYTEWAQKGLLLDISDIVTTVNAEYGETRSIESKLSDEKKAMLTGVKGKEGKYYGLPHYEGFLGVNYNVDVFDQNGLYFGPDGKLGATLADARSAGPDGQPNTADDGLPATIAQFKTLCRYINNNTDAKPFVWTGMYNEYFNILMDALVTAQLGKEGSEVFYTFNLGEKKVASQVVTGFTGDTPIIETQIIGETTGDKLWQLAASYYAADFAQSVIENGWHTDESVGITYSHTDAQRDFINGARANKPVAMLIDGNYWENEARNLGTIAASENNYNYDYDTESNFAWMPLPGVATGTEGTTKMTLKDSMQSFAFINANIANDENKVKLAKMFLQFCFTDSALVDFTLTTGMTRDYDYTLTAAQENTLGKYARSIWNYRKTSELVNTASTSALFAANQEILLNTYWRSQVGSATYDRPYTAFYTGGVTAKDFFNGLHKLHENWASENREYFVEAD